MRAQLNVAASAQRLLLLSAHYKAHTAQVCHLFGFLLRILCSCGPTVGARRRGQRGAIRFSLLHLQRSLHLLRRLTSCGGWACRPKISGVAKAHRAVDYAVCSPVLVQTERPHTLLGHFRCLGSCTLLGVIGTDWLRRISYQSCSLHKRCDGRSTLFMHAMHGRCETVLMGGGGVYLCHSSIENVCQKKKVLVGIAQGQARRCTSLSFSQ
jgi:hypothetical protein